MPFPFGLGIWELILIFSVIILLFGAKRLPEIGKSLGSSIREFKGAFRELGTIAEEEDREIKKLTRN